MAIELGQPVPDFSAPATFPTFAEGHKEIVLCEAILRSHKEKEMGN